MITWTSRHDYEHVAQGVGYRIFRKGCVWYISDRGQTTSNGGFLTLVDAKARVQRLVEQEIEAAKTWGTWRGYTAAALSAAAPYADTPAIDGRHNGKQIGPKSDRLLGTQ
ncbi:MAG TPA: hypothetical protein VJ998_01225 [Pseudomonadales bacterium]|nr:hypothetical protein [Pseudomonadales bacterium]